MILEDFKAPKTEWEKLHRSHQNTHSINEIADKYRIKGMLSFITRIIKKMF